MNLGQPVRIIHEGLPCNGVIVGALPEFDAYDVRVAPTVILWNRKAKELDPMEGVRANV
jgi:hypothetical protein